ncbi:hypothetical protein BHM03_00011062, partial [Ensete ventricosum]
SLPRPPFSLDDFHSEHFGKLSTSAVVFLLPLHRLFCDAFIRPLDRYHAQCFPSPRPPSARSSSAAAIRVQMGKGEATFAGDGGGGKSRRRWAWAAAGALTAVALAIAAGSRNALEIPASATNSCECPPLQLQRNEVIVLFNLLNRLSESVKFVRDMGPLMEKMERHDSSPTGKTPWQ